MSWQCTSWALREAPAPTANARLVLIALADRCGPDGRRAWPTITTLSQEAHCSKASTKRALKALEESGCIRRGDQSLAIRDENGQWLPPQYRPIVWECCMDVTIENPARKPGRQARVEREKRGVGQESEQAGTSRGLKMSPLNSSGVTSDTSRGLTSDTSIKETNIETNTYPSVPTGHLPAGGEIHADEENTEPEPGNVEPSMSVQDDPAREVLDALDLMRSRLGLPVERPNGRDVSKAGGLVAKVASANDGDTGRALAWILAVIGWMPSNTFWLRRVTNGRSLASNWSQIANDYAVDQLETQRRHDAEARDRDKPDTGRARKATPGPPVYTPHSTASGHVVQILGLRSLARAGVTQHDIDSHLTAQTDTSDCRVCTMEPLNRATHGLTAGQSDAN
ncbi:helix-turn-helix domain-containing protein [Bifidobacterium catenulatum]|uniref:helix-turn-helix domain-containing protein n=1 Tax=Bifidobacterium catenulatum TaxID=1686 RepID=UPI003D32DCE7